MSPLTRDCFLKAAQFHQKTYFCKTKFSFSTTSNFEAIYNSTQYFENIFQGLPKDLQGEGGCFKTFSRVYPRIYKGEEGVSRSSVKGEFR